MSDIVVSRQWQYREHIPNRGGGFDWVGDADAGWIVGANTTAAEANTKITGLVAGRRYDFRVVDITEGSGDNPPSVVRATSNLATRTPFRRPARAPINITCAPGEPVGSTTSCFVGWTPDTFGGPADSFTVQYRISTDWGGNGDWVNGPTLSASEARAVGHSATVTGLTVGVLYQFQVLANWTNPEGNPLPGVQPEGVVVGANAVSSAAAAAFMQSPIYSPVPPFLLDSGRVVLGDRIFIPPVREVRTTLTGISMVLNRSCLLFGGGGQTGYEGQWTWDYRVDGGDWTPIENLNGPVTLSGLTGTSHTVQVRKTGAETAGGFFYSVNNTDNIKFESNTNEELTETIELSRETDTFEPGQEYELRNPGQSGSNDRMSWSFREVKASVIGGGGGHGAAALGYRGGVPSKPGKVDGIITVDYGERLKFCAGGAGTSAAGRSPGGLGGANVLGLYDGGNGAAAGPYAAMGAGGGGGAASVVLRSNNFGSSWSTIIVAGGASGGAGASLTADGTDGVDTAGGHTDGDGRGQSATARTGTYDRSPGPAGGGGGTRAASGPGLAGGTSVAGSSTINCGFLRKCTVVTYTTTAARRGQNQVSTDRVDTDANGGFNGVGTGSADGAPGSISVEYLAVSNSTYLSATGGTTGTYTRADGTTWKFHRFNSDGSFTITSRGTSNRSRTIEYLVVGGGGSGASSQEVVGGTERGGGGGGGGGGGVLIGTLSDLPANVAQSVTVGEGGAASAAGNNNGNNGANSSFRNLIALGGGGGGAWLSTGSTGSSGSSGGSGGGGGGYGRAAGGSGTEGQGTAGGSSRAKADSGRRRAGGGGGGALSPGSNADPFDGSNSSKGGDGGDGRQSSITGTSVTYGSGGGGGAYDSANPGAGNAAAGIGGGGAGDGGALTANSNSSTVADIEPTAGTDGTGGGGGGAAGIYNAARQGAAGGRGVVIIAYETSPAT